MRFRSTLGVVGDELDLCRSRSAIRGDATLDLRLITPGDQVVDQTITATVLEVLVGLGIGISAGGILIDYLIRRGVAQPYTWTLLGFTFLSMTAIPLFYLAGRRLAQDRVRLLEQEQDTEDKVRVS